MNVNISFTNINNQFRAQEISMQRSKMASLTEAVLEDPGNIFCQALLNQTIKRLELLLAA